MCSKSIEFNHKIVVYHEHKKSNKWSWCIDIFPCRFLDENGKYRPHEKLVPFGIGKRSCPGKTLADTEIFLFVAAFVQHFQFSFPDEFQPPDEIEPEVGFVLCCPPYDMVIEEHWST